MLFVFFRTVDSGEVLPSIKLLTEIASYLPKVKHCLRLAKVLGFSKDIVERVQEKRFMRTALQILCKWKQKKSSRATGRVLFEALITINKRDIAAAFSQELLGQGDRNCVFFFQTQYGVIVT